VGGRGREIFASAKCQLQFAKASAATLSQQEKNETADVQRGKSKYIRFYRHSGKLALAPMHLRRAQVVGRSITAGAQPLSHVCTAGACGIKTRHGPPAALPGAGVWRHGWGDGAHGTSGRHGAKYRSLNHVGLKSFRNSKFSCARLFQNSGSSQPPHTEVNNFAFSPAAVSAGSPLYCSVF
jgi:hypothetical protein